MKCTKCGSDAVMKDGDWLTCLNCGNVMFDTRRPGRDGGRDQPHQAAGADGSRCGTGRGTASAPHPPGEKAQVPPQSQGCRGQGGRKESGQGYCGLYAAHCDCRDPGSAAENTCVCQCGSALRLHAQHHRDRRPDRGQPTGLYHQRPPAVRCGDLQIPGR